MRRAGAGPGAGAAELIWRGKQRSAPSPSFRVGWWAGVAVLGGKRPDESALKKMCDQPVAFSDTMRQCERRGWAFFSRLPKKVDQKPRGLGLDRLRCAVPCAPGTNVPPRDACSRAQHHGSCRDPKPGRISPRKVRKIVKLMALEAGGCCVPWLAPVDERRWWLLVAFPWELGSGRCDEAAAARLAGFFDARLCCACQRSS
ncbi:hypothetical protein B0T14DRAFT_244281 [Immersiella caudata]|uniref:Uncharacterized protein n=1 Tax=Immersiella caudata TaxID=314043 RepID=A0AA40BWL1_9PEZI|nr:hypothetical protein B0T14DRAFT_244281 [Immersiella caudata]